MSNKDEISIAIKVSSVIASCKTFEQLTTANKYYNLSRKYLTIPFQLMLLRRFSFRRQLIYTQLLNNKRIRENTNEK